ncbi:MAG: 3-deoxy-D-manno-octulosonic acid transferase, partial [Acidobacteriota bacterium]
GLAGPALWIHAVSVGEVLSLRNLISRVNENHPSWSIYFSTLTNTGYRVATEALAEADRVFLIPLDFASLARRFFIRLRPQVFILAESEFWPNLLREARRSCRSVLLINGRVSSRAHRNYRRLKPLAKRVLDNITYLLVQSATDKARLEDLGIASERIQVAGNLKAEVRLPRLDPAEVEALKRAFGIAGRKKVIVAGSTHRGEEEIVLGAFAEVRKTRPNLLLVVAPRHPERAGEAEKISARLGLKARRRTETGDEMSWEVLVLDTIGELAKLYALADLAFIGGSLVPHGGQNLLEPAFYGRPIAFGPHMHNFAALAEAFLEARAARLVRSQRELADVFARVDDAGLEEMGRKAGELLASFQGATERTLQMIERLMAEAGAGD